MSAAKKDKPEKPEKEKGGRLRVSFDADSEAVRRAIYIAAAMKGMTHNEVLCWLIRTGLSEYLDLAVRAIAEEEAEAKKKK